MEKKIRNAYRRVENVATLVAELKKRWHYGEYPQHDPEIENTIEWIEDVAKAKEVTAFYVVTTEDVDVLHTATENNLEILFEVGGVMCTAQWDTRCNAYRFYDALAQWNEVLE